MKWLLSGISGWLVEHDAINSDDRKLYEYAIYIFLISIVPLTVFLIVSGIIGMLPEGLFIISPFMLIRKFCGGYHAKHAYTCMFISGVLLGLCLYIVKHVTGGLIFHVLVLVSGTSIIFNSPIDNENKKLEDVEIITYRKKTIMLVLVTILFYGILIFAGEVYYSKCLAIGIILTAFLQMPCILKKDEEK